jgi:hypothetical protein
LCRIILMAINSIYTDSLGGVRIVAGSVCYLNLSVSLQGALDPKGSCIFIYISVTLLSNTRHRIQPRRYVVARVKHRLSTKRMTSLHLQQFFDVVVKIYDPEMTTPYLRPRSLGV